MCQWIQFTWAFIYYQMAFPAMRKKHYDVSGICLLVWTTFSVMSLVDPTPVPDNICTNIISSCRCTNKGTLARIKCTVPAASNSSLHRLLISELNKTQSTSIDLLDLSSSDLSSIPADFLTGVSRINTIKAQHCGLSKIPAFILNMRKVAHLNLSHNLFVNLSLDFIVNMKLRGLSLAYNKVEHIIVKGELNPTLVNMDLKHNQLTELPVDIWLSLQEIDVSHNALSMLPSLPSQSPLRKLSASHNQVVEFPSKFFESTSVLQTLDLAWNGLQMLKKVQQKNVNLEQLQKLVLSHNNIQYLSVGLLDAMPKLVHLDLSHNKLQSLNHDVFPPQSSGLQFLNLSYNALNYVHHTTFHHLESLRDLILSHNPGLGQQGIGHLGLPDHLVSLDLTNCSLTTLDYCQIKHLHDLGSLHVSHNQLMCTCHLYLLYSWFIHHSPSKRDTPNDEHSWQCLPSDNQSPVLIIQRPCVESVSCPSVETSIQQREGVQVHLKVVRAKQHIITTWTIADISHQVVGFRVLCMHQGQEVSNQQEAEQTEQDTAAVHVSPILSTDLRSYTVTNVDADDHFIVCIDVLSNTTRVIKRVCEAILTERPNILAGILTGVIFLLPCIIFIVYVLIKDKKIKHSSYDVVQCKDQQKSGTDENQLDDISELPVFYRGLGLFDSLPHFNHTLIHATSISEPCLFNHHNASTQTENASISVDMNNGTAEVERDRSALDAAVYTAVPSHFTVPTTPTHQADQSPHLCNEMESPNGVKSTLLMQDPGCEVEGRSLTSIEDDIAFLEQEVSSLQDLVHDSKSTVPLLRPTRNNHAAMADHTTQALDHLDDLVSELQALITASAEEEGLAEYSDDKH